MAATVNIKRWTGASGSMSGTIISGINTVANACDYHQTPASSSTDPIKIPASGTRYSYWVSTRLATGAVGPTGTINNLRWYCDGSNTFGTGVGCNVAEADVYYQASGTVGVTGTEMTVGNHPGIVDGPAAFTSKTSGSPLGVTGSTTAANTDFGNYVIYQLTVDPSASAGATGSEQYSWLYDES